MRRSVQLFLRFAAVVVLGVVSIALVVSQVIPQLAKVPDAVSFTPATDLKLPTLPEGSTVVDESGAQIGILRGSENRVVVPLDQMSEELRSTVLAVEDADFYEHGGVSAKSVLRAIRANSESGEVSQGGSTITQQLVKLSLVGDDQTIERKIKEASLAIQLEDQLCEDAQTKQDCKNIILQQYLNQIYFGQGAYGAEAAARVYFNKSAAEINLAEASVLASLIRNPVGYDPIENPEVAKDRREVVLERMQDEDLITAEGAEYISALPLPTQAYGRSAAVDSGSISYVEKKIRDELLKAEWLAPTEEQRRYLIFNGGLKITSTIDQRAQALAEQAAAKNPIAESNPQTRVALAAVEPSTGAVRAIVGETVIDGKPIEIGDPVRGVRSGEGGYSTGSAFKPITLIAALEQGYTIKDTISGAPLSREAKEDLYLENPSATYPSGCSAKNYGSQSLALKLQQSNNCAFMRLQNSLGFDAVKAEAINLGLTPGPLDPNDNRPACFTIGCDALVTPLGMARAFSTIANDGRKNPTHFVSRVEDRDGNVIFEYAPPNEQVIRPESSRQAIQAMEGVVTGGTCTRCQLPKGQEAAGKTGTVELKGANVGVWFSGFTPQLAAAVWVGDPLDQNTNLKGSPQGGRVAGPIWQDFMASYLEDVPAVDFTDPAPVAKATSIPDPWLKSSKSSTSSDTSAAAGDDGDDAD